MPCYSEERLLGLQWSVPSLPVDVSAFPLRKQVWWSLPKPQRITILLIQAAYNLQQLAVPVARISKIRQAKEGDRSGLSLDGEAGGWGRHGGRRRFTKQWGLLVLCLEQSDWGFSLATSPCRTERTTEEPGLSSLHPD